MRQRCLSVYTSTHSVVSLHEWKLEKYEVPTSQSLPHQGAAGETLKLSPYQGSHIVYVLAAWGSAVGVESLYQLLRWKGVSDIALYVSLFSSTD